MQTKKKQMQNNPFLCEQSDKSVMLCNYHIQLPSINFNAKKDGITKCLRKNVSLRKIINYVIMDETMNDEKTNILYAKN